MELNINAYALDFNTCLNNVSTSTDEQLAEKRMTKAYKSRLEKESYKDFTKRDWMTYWIMKAKEHDVAYIVGNSMKEYSVLDSLRRKFKPNEVKAMIDFLWDSEQDMFIKSSMGVLVLRSDCINGIYQNSQDWIFGKYKTRAQWKQEKRQPTKRNREWVGEDNLIIQHDDTNSVIRF